MALVFEVVDLANHLHQLRRSLVSSRVVCRAVKVLTSRGLQSGI